MCANIPLVRDLTNAMRKKLQQLHIIETAVSEVSIHYILTAINNYTKLARIVSRSAPSINGPVCSYIISFNRALDSEKKKIILKFRNRGAS